jgi:deoxyadenosine/deoxycytidine kinase
MQLPSEGDVTSPAAVGFIRDADYQELARWCALMAEEAGDGVHVSVTDAGDARLDEREKDLLRGMVIIIEGGVGQGKTSLCRAIEAAVADAGVPCSVQLEPVDKRKLELFMKFGTVKVDAASSPLDTELAEVRRQAKQAAAIQMQFAMLRARSANMRAAADDARSGSLAVVDRGPFGDCAFMSTTFSENGISEAMRLRYMVEYQRLYLGVNLPASKTVVVRMTASSGVTFERWCARESKVAGNKYDPEYVKRIEDAHDVCERAWGKCLLYDNTDVPVDSNNVPAKAAAVQLLKHACRVCGECDVDRIPVV